MFLASPLLRSPPRGAGTDANANARPESHAAKKHASSRGQQAGLSAKVKSTQRQQTRAVPPEKAAEGGKATPKKQAGPAKKDTKAATKRGVPHFIRRKHVTVEIVRNGGCKSSLHIMSLFLPIFLPILPFAGSRSFDPSVGFWDADGGLSEGLLSFGHSLPKLCHADTRTLQHAWASPWSCRNAPAIGLNSNASR